jgi:hypothetical protein
MGEVINLNRVLKTKAKEQKKIKAEGNRIRHGLTKAEKLMNTAHKEREKLQLDGHKRDDDAL